MHHSVRGCYIYRNNEINLRSKIKCQNNNKRCIEIYLKRYSGDSTVDQSFKELQRDILMDFCKENNIEIITGE